MILKENYYGKCRKKIKEFEGKVQIFFGRSG
nr:MAG TPA: KIX domain [Caudoviricetes sp.]